MSFGRELLRVHREDLVSAEAERAVLGCILAEPAVFHEVTEVVTARDFHGLAHSLILAAMGRLAGRGEAIDHLTLSEELKAMPWPAGHEGAPQSNPLIVAGGPAYLMQLDQGVPLVANVLEYARTVRALAERRAVAAIMSEAFRHCFDLNRPLDKTAHETAARLVHSTAPKHALVNGEEVLRRVLEKSDDAQVGGKPTRLLRTNIRAWDEDLRGVPLQEVTIVAAHPAVGKTSVLAAMAEAMAAGGVDQAPCVVSYHSLEDHGDAIFRRYLASASGLSIRQLFEPGLSQEQMDMRARGVDALALRAANIWVDDESGQNVHSVAQKIRYAHKAYGIRVALVDHLLEMVDFADERRQDERVGEILRVLRDCAKSLDIAVVLAVHLRRSKDDAVDYRFIRPVMQLIAGAEYVARMARLVVGLWFTKPPPEPKPPKPLPEPRIPKKATREEHEAILEKWQEAKRAAEHEYNKALSRWRQESELASGSLVATKLKVTEGAQLEDFHLARILHAGLVDRFK